MKRVIIILMTLGVAMLAGCQSEKNNGPKGLAITLPTVTESWVAYTNGEPGDAPKKMWGSMNGWYNNAVWMMYSTADYTDLTRGDEDDPMMNPQYGVINTLTHPGQRETVVQGQVVLGTGMTAFTPTLFYPANNWVYLRGVYPQEGIITAGMTESDYGTSVFGLDQTWITWDLAKTDIYGNQGQLDVMISNSVCARNDGADGGRPLNYVPYYTFESEYERTQSQPDGHPRGVLEYYHKLTRIAFAISVSTGWPETFKLTQIEIRGVHTKVRLDVSQNNTLVVGQDPMQPTRTQVDLLQADTIPSSVGNLSYKWNSGLAVSDYSPDLYTGVMRESMPMAYMMFPEGETFTIYCTFANTSKNPIEYDVIQVTNIHSIDPSAPQGDITQGTMVRGRSYLVHVNFRLVGLAVTTHAYWNEETITITSPGVGGDGTVGGLNPDDNRWW